MILPRRALLAGLAGLPLLRAAPAAAVAPSPAVDLALLMAVDASASISKGTLDFQLRGHAAAFRDPALHRSVGAGPQGRIAVQLCQFAGPDQFVTLLPWTELAGAEDCNRLAAAIDTLPGVAMGGSTALGAAVVEGVKRLDTSPYPTSRKAIDLVSNGFSNAGVDPLSAGAHAAAAGVTVNALAILDEFDWLEPYYAETVIAGEGSFVRTADGPDSFAAAFLDKLVTEIA